MMTQVPRMSSRAASSVEVAHDTFERIVASGVMRKEEIQELRFALDRAVFTAARADLASALSVCVARTGPDGYRYRDLCQQWDELAVGSEPPDAA